MAAGDSLCRGLRQAVAAGGGGGRRLRWARQGAVRAKLRRLLATPDMPYNHCKGTQRSAVPPNPARSGLLA